VRSLHPVQVAAFQQGLDAVTSVGQHVLDQVPPPVPVPRRQPLGQSLRGREPPLDDAQDDVDHPRRPDAGIGHVQHRLFHP
jgi:hypothetical protein